MVGFDTVGGSAGYTRHRVPRSLKIGLFAAAGLIVLSTASFFLLFPSIGTWVVRSKVLPRVAERLDRRLAVAHIDVRYGHVALRGITLSGPNDPPGLALTTVDRISVDFDFWAALRGDVRLGTVVIESPRIELRRGADGVDNISDLVARLRHGGDAGAGSDGSGGARRLLPPGVEVRGGSLVAVDEASGLRAGIDVIDGTVTLHPGGHARLTLGGAHADHRLGPRLQATLIVDADLDDPRGTLAITVQNGSATVWPKLSLTNIAGTVRAGTPAGRAVIELQGGYGGVDEVLWRAEGWLDPAAPAGQFKLRADRFSLDKIEKVLADTPIKDPDKTAVNAALDLTLDKGLLTFAGALEFSGLTIYDAALADDPVRDLGFRGAIKGRYALLPRIVTLDEAHLSFRGVDAELDGQAALVGGLEDDGTARPSRRVRAHLVVAPVPCQTALEAVPRELTPRLQGFKLKGQFAADLHTEIDWANLDGLDLGGSVGIWGCKAVDVPADLKKERLMDEFEHVVELQANDFMSFIVGPSNPDFVPLADVSPYLTNSLMTTEDSGFMKHHGFITREFKSALIKDLKEGYFKYGASSITMQLVKNVFLYRQKTLARKLQELFLTWYIETVLPKERLLEMYVNVIEFGPGIYGIGPAARHYFGKLAKDLGPTESAFFSSILPNPKGRYLQYCKGELTKWGDAKIQRILKLERDRGLLTTEELDTALATPLAFDRAEALPEAECVRQTKLMIEKARPAAPAGVPRKTGG
jgi:hypothetical protein